LGEGHNYTSWLAEECGSDGKQPCGRIEFILFQVFAWDMPEGATLHIADFDEVSEDYTPAPSESVAPSISPSNMIQDNVGYVIKYAGEIRTVIQAPFQIDGSGEVLPMDGSVKYKLCGVDEVEGSKAPFPNR